jgi:predicted TIM-barrel fold metal-dependent hydrolase
MPRATVLVSGGEQGFFATFMDDPVGIANTSFVGRDNFMWASDYPHTLATWPHSREVIARDFKEVAADVKSKMIGETAARLYGLLA